MNKHDVKNPGQALAYVTDCTLATVCGLAMKKSRSKSEFSRQKNIAQVAIDWMRAMDVEFSTTRADAVVKAGGVDSWAEQFFPAK